MKLQKVKKGIESVFSGRNLASRIRYSYLVLVVPFVALLLYCIWNLWSSNRRYDEMIRSTRLATEFGLDFAGEFNDETYLLIAGATPLHESKLSSRLSTARAAVNMIAEGIDSADNRQRLLTVQNYIDYLETYTERIETKLLEGNKYEECIEIWENDVKTVTELISDKMSEFTYYEMCAIQESKTENERIYRNMILSSVIGFAVAIILIIVLSYLIPRSLTRPITEITLVTDEVANGNLSVHAKEYEGTEAKILADSINVMIDRINELLIQIKQEQLSLRKAEFELLQAQINPHFLYNTLDCIVWLAESDDREKVVEMVENLSSFFRTSLNQGREIVKISDEVEHIRSYLSIQQIRYQDILKYEINVEEALLDHDIPKLSLQPFVENALYHGIKEKRGGGAIHVSGGIDNNRIILTVEDNGAGMSEERLKQVRTELEIPNRNERSIYGMYNVNQRIKLNYGKEYGVEIESTLGVGTKVRIILPMTVGNSVLIGAN